MFKIGLKSYAADAQISWQNLVQRLGIDPKNHEQIQWLTSTLRVGSDRIATQVMMPLDQPRFGEKERNAFLAIASRPQNGPIGVVALLAGPASVTSGFRKPTMKLPSPLSLEASKEKDSTVSGDSYDPVMLERFLERVAKGESDFSDIDFKMLPRDAFQKIPPSQLFRGKICDIDLATFDLSNIEFHKSVFSRVKLEGTIAYLQDITMTSSNLSLTKFSITNGENSFDTCLLKGSNFENPCGIDKFHNSNLSDATFGVIRYKIGTALLMKDSLYYRSLVIESCRAVQTTFANTNIGHAQFRNSDLTGSVFYGFNPLDARAEFYNCQARKTRFYGIVGNNVRFSRVDLRGSTFDDFHAVLNDINIFTDATLSRRSLVNSFGPSFFWYAKTPDGSPFEHIPQSKIIPRNFRSIRTDLRKFLSREAVKQLEAIAVHIDKTKSKNDLKVIQNFLRVCILRGIDFREPHRRYFEETIKIVAAHPKETYPWLHQFYHMIQFPDEVTDAFVEEDLAAYDRLPETLPRGQLQKKNYLFPERIARRWQEFLFKYIATTVHSKDPTLAARLANHCEQFPLAWKDGNFLQYLATMASFMDDQGHETLRELVEGLASTPVTDQNFDTSFRYQRLRKEKIFSDTLLDRWAGTREVKVLRKRSKSARNALYEVIQKQLGDHLGKPLEQISKPSPKVRAVIKKLNHLLDLLSKEADVDSIAKSIALLLKSLTEAKTITALNGTEVELDNAIRDLKALTRGLPRTAAPLTDEEKERVEVDTAVFSDRPQDHTRSGLIAMKTCVQPKEPAEGNKSGEPLTWALEGQFKVAIYKIRNREVARTELEITIEDGQPHLLVERLYAEGGFSLQETFANTILAEAKRLGIPKKNVHIEFTGLNTKKYPKPLPTKGKVNRDTF